MIERKSKTISKTRIKNFLTDCNYLGKKVGTLWCAGYYTLGNKQKFYAGINGFGIDTNVYHRNYDAHVELTDIVIKYLNRQIYKDEATIQILERLRKELK